MEAPHQYTDACHMKSFVEISSTRVPRLNQNYTTSRLETCFLADKRSLNILEVHMLINQCRYSLRIFE